MRLKIYNNQSKKSGMIEGYKIYTSKSIEIRFYLKFILALMFVVILKADVVFAWPKENNTSEDSRLGVSIVTKDIGGLFEIKPSKISLTQLLSALSKPGFLRYPVDQSDIVIIKWGGKTTKDWYANGTDRIDVILSKNYLQRHGLSDKYNGLVVHFKDVNVDSGYIKGKAEAEVEVLEPIYSLDTHGYVYRETAIKGSEHGLFCSGDGWLPSKNSLDGKRKNIYFGDNLVVYMSEKEYLNKDLSTKNPLKDLLDIDLKSQSVKGQSGTRLMWVSYSNKKPVFQYTVKPNNLAQFKSNVVAGVKYRIGLALDSEVEYMVSDPFTRIKKKKMSEIIQIILDPASNYIGQGVFSSANDILSVTGVGGLLEQKVLNYNVVVYFKSIEPITDR